MTTLIQFRFSCDDNSRDKSTTRIHEIIKTWTFWMSSFLCDIVIVVRFDDEMHFKYFICVQLKHFIIIWWLNVQCSECIHKLMIAYNTKYKRNATFSWTFINRSMCILHHLRSEEIVISWTVKKLRGSQLNFYPSPSILSISVCIYRICFHFPSVSIWLYLFH